MKTESEIIHKFFQARFRHIQKRCRKAKRRRPSSCRYNVLFRSKSGKQVGCCKYREISGDDDWSVQVCDEETAEGCNQARACPVFEPAVVEADVVDFVDQILLEGSWGEVAYQFPDLAALLWVLDDMDREDLYQRLRHRSEGGSDVGETIRDQLRYRPGGDVDYDFPLEEDQDEHPAGQQDKGQRDLEGGRQDVEE